MARKRAAGDDFHLVEKRLGKILQGDMTKTALASFAQKLTRLKGKEVDREAPADLAPPPALSVNRVVRPTGRALAIIALLLLWIMSDRINR
jgi:hypothetical protein